MTEKKAHIKDLIKIVDTYLDIEQKHYEENPTKDHIYHSLLNLDKGLKLYQDERDAIMKLKDAISDFRKGN